MHDHGWLLTCAVLLLSPATAVAQEASAATGSEPTERDLRELEAKYEETGEPKYLFERALTLEKMGEYQFALKIIEKHRKTFENDPDVDGVSVVEQRLRRRVSDGSDGETTHRGGPGPWDWILVGTGAGSLAGGLTSILVADHRAKRLRCSPVSQGPDATGCGGVTPYSELSRSEFDAKRRGVRTLRAVGIGLGAAGLGLATWGVVRMLDGTDRSRSADGRAALQVRPALAWTPNEVELSLELRF